MRIGTLGFLLLALAAAPHTSTAQGTTQREDPASAAVADAGHAVDIITPHITDCNCVDLPYWKSPFVKEVPSWPPSWGRLHIGALDITPTKHVWMLLLAAVLCALTLIITAQAHERQHERGGHPKGFVAGIEAMVLFLRNDVVLRNVGPHGERFVPFGLTLFFFILYANLLGLLPYGSTATGNISVTATLAIITFFVVEITGMQTQGAGYLRTIFYIPPADMPFFLKPLMMVIMTPVEIIGKLTKPFALAIRLFANMIAGHVIVLALIGLIFTFGIWFFAMPVAMAVGIMLLELFVAFLQAYIFALLASVFIGLIRAGGH